MTKIEYKDIIAFHPGYYIKEYIDNNNITQEELSKRLQTSAKYVSDLVNARINLTEEMILKLAVVFNTSTKMWLNLNQKYIEKKLEIDRLIQLDKECEYIDLVDYNYWVKLGLVKSCRNKEEKVNELQRYLKVSSLGVLTQRDFLVQYRSSINDIKDINVINANAWVQTAINIASNIDVEPFDKKKFNESIKEIRSMITQSPEEFCPKLKKILSDCGVVLVLLPNLKNCGVNGAVKWLGKDKVVLALNDRRKYADVFWFSLFHELGHVRQQRLKVTFVNDKKINYGEIDELLIELEKEANSFSRDQLIPLNEYNDFLLKHKYNLNQESIVAFAKKINVLPGIVVGRLQNDNYLANSSHLNNLKAKYEITI